MPMIVCIILKKNWESNKFVQLIICCKNIRKYSRAKVMQWKLIFKANINVILYYKVYNFHNESYYNEMLI